MREQARHPGRTPAQRRVLDAIGRGDHSPRMSRVLRDALLRHGLIVPIELKRFTLGIGAVLVEQFEMPVNVHMQWRAAVAGGRTMTDRKPEFPTPWRVKSDRYGIWLVDADGRIIDGETKQGDLRIARRIVAAVNAAEGKDGSSV